MFWGLRPWGSGIGFGVPYVFDGALYGHARL